MAEVAYSVFKDLTRLLKDEAEFLYGVRDDVEEMERELKRMQALLKDVDGAAHDMEKSERLRNWVEEIRELAYEAEDVIEDFIVNEQRKRHRRSKGKFGIFNRYACIPGSSITLHEVGTNIKKINEKMKKISDSSSKYGIPHIGEGSTSQVIQPRRSGKPLVPLEEEDIIGLDGEVEEITRRLTNGDNRLCVISIFGMGGLGKTTLARKAYIKVKGSMNFDCFAWITVSKEYIPKDLLLVMVKKIMGEELDDNKKLADVDLAEKLCDFLKTTKYFIILDDIWSVEFWKTVNVFRDVNNGSAVMITTRFEDVARSIGPHSYPIKLKFPESDECLNLLFKRAGLKDASCCPVGLLDPANKIIKRCGRLPLYIIAIGGILLSKTPIATEWWKVADKIKWEYSKRPEDCIEVLGLSYDDLPIHLKNCFLYFGLFPEDREIDARELIRLWVAEGFVQETEEMTMEEVAQEYLINLIDRSMVQMVEKDFLYYFTSSVHDTCRVHDLMRELAILKATQTRFLSTKPLTDARRLTICETAGKEEAAIGDQPIFENLRTILAFGTESKNPKSICNRSPRVRVLHASCCKIDNVHDFCRKHPHLRYLDVQFITIHGNVIKDISCLYHLQTLSISSVYGEAANISQLRNLRHLILEDTDIRLDGLCGAKNLQTLDGITAGDWIESSLSKLTNLRTLKINECKVSHGKALAVPLVQLKCLVTLHLLTGEDNIGLPSLCTLSSLVNLRDLIIDGGEDKISFFGPVPKSHEELPRRLSSLRLCGVCNTEHYPIEMLGKLTCLRSLYIYEYNYHHDPIDYEVWHMKHGDFPHLQFLNLTCVERLREWIIEDGALQQLHYLRISCCNELKMLPDGLRLISTLRELYFMIKGGTPLEGRVEKETGDDWDKIKHVPLMKVDHTG